MGEMGKLREIWHTYSPSERRNIAIYIVGIMFYKFGLEAFNGSITTLAVDRFGSQAFKKQGMLQGLNQAFQVSNDFDERQECSSVGDVMLTNYFAVCWFNSHCPINQAIPNTLCPCFGNHGVWAFDCNFNDCGCLYWREN